MTDDERAIRERMSSATTRLQSALRRCPAIDSLDHIEINAAAAAVAAATAALHEAVGCTAELEALQSLSEEGILLIATSGTALGVVREVLTTLQAAIDGHSLAA